MIISELRRIIGWFWVAQAKKCILCTMYVRKKHNRSGSTSVVVASKASGKYKEINRVHQKYGVAHNNILFVKYIINEVGETV